MSTRTRFRLAHGWPAPALVAAVAAVGLILGLASLATNQVDGYAAPLLGFLAATLYVMTRHRRKVHARPDRVLDVTMVLAIGAAILLLVLPTYLYATPKSLLFRGIVHRSVISAILLLGISLPALCSALYHMFGATPNAQDISRIPLLVLPAVLALALYGLFLGSSFAEGLPPLIRRPQVLFLPFPALDPGLGKHILGTLVLVAMTALLSLPIGVGTGVYLAEYASGRLGQWVATTTTVLRSVSVFILGLGAMYAVRMAKGTFLSDLICGYQIMGGDKVSSDGTFFTAALFLSLLVIPIITRAAEEGCRSMPQDLREGSWALAASEGYTLWRVTLPWAWPNIITGLLLGCAEAAGSVAVIMFVAKTLEYPFSLFNHPSVLSFLIYELAQGRQRELQAYQVSAAVLLVLFTMGLNTAALIIKNRFAARYRRE